MINIGHTKFTNNMRKRFEGSRNHQNSAKLFAVIDRLCFYSCH